MKQNSRRSELSVLSAALGVLSWAIFLADISGMGLYQWFGGYLERLPFTFAPAAIVVGILALVLKRGRRGLALAGIVLGALYLALMGLIVWAFLNVWEIG